MEKLALCLGHLLGLTVGSSHWGMLLVIFLICIKISLKLKPHCIFLKIMQVPRFPIQTALRLYFSQVWKGQPWLEVCNE